MVGVAEILFVEADSFEGLVVEDVVDTDHLLTSAECVHEAASTLFEAVDLVAEHRVVDVGVGDVVEVTTDQDGHFGLAHIHGNGICL